MRVLHSHSVFLLRYAITLVLSFKMFARVSVLSLALSCIVSTTAALDLDVQNKGNDDLFHLRDYDANVYRLYHTGRAGSCRWNR